MRVTTLFKRLLGFGRERVLGVDLVDEGDKEVLVVDLARPAARRLICSGCGHRVRAAYDQRVVSWRHLDVIAVAHGTRAGVPAPGLTGRPHAPRRPGSLAERSVIARIFVRRWATGPENAEGPCVNTALQCN